MAGCVLCPTHVSIQLQDAILVMIVNLDNYLGTYASAVSLRAERAEILANNLANGDTPQFKARDFSFADALRSATNHHAPGVTAVKLTASQEGHLKANGSAYAQLQYRVPTQYALDGNTVQTDYEKAEFTENSVRYEASLQLLGGRISGLMKALRGE